MSHDNHDFLLIALTRVKSSASLWAEHWLWDDLIDFQALHTYVQLPIASVPIT